MHLNEKNDKAKRIKIPVLLLVIGVLKKKNADCANNFKGKSKSTFKSNKK